MRKILSYSPLSIVIILAISAVFYLLTADEIIFLGGDKQPASQKILPDSSVKSADTAIIEEPPDSDVSDPDMAQGPATAPTPIPKLKPKPIAQAQSVEVPLEVVEGPTTHIVSITAAEGFNPRIVVIKQGDTVRWINNDTKLHWPASDPHPTHTGLSGFDPLADILPKESYSFTFGKPGIYGYHDHTQAVVDGLATLIGIVRVLEK